MNRNIFSVLFIIFAIVLSLFLWIPLKEWAGVLLIPCSFVLPFFAKEFRRDKRLLLFTSLAIVIRQVVSLLNAYYTTLYGADLDAATFHRIAGEIAQSIQPSWFDQLFSLDAGSQIYAKSLGFVYKYLGHSLLLGQELSIISYVISCIILIKMASSLGLGKWGSGIVILYGFLPPGIIFESVTMRESWEALFFLSVCYFALRFRNHTSIFRVLGIVACGICLGMLHNGLAVYALFLICYSLFWGLKFRITIWNAQNIFAQLLAIVLFVGVIYAWWSLASDIGGASRALVSGEATTYYGTYREKGEQGARANYEVRLDTSSVPSSIITGFLAFIFYMFAPFPWQISGALDTYAFFESMLRFLLLYQAIKTWWYAQGERKKRYFFLLICFLSLEFLWSFGTANWGTAIRHHLVAYGLLLLTGGPGLIVWTRKIMYRFTKRRREKVFIPRRFVQG